MEEKENLLEELYASYNGDAFADWLKGAVEKNGEMVMAEKIIDDYSFRQAGSQIPGTICYRVNYWPRVKREFNKLVCGHSPYEKESQDYYVFGKFFSLATASSMATSISQIVDVPIYVLTPTIALMLHSIMKIGRNAYCSTVEI